MQGIEDADSAFRHRPLADPGNGRWAQQRFIALFIAHPTNLLGQHMKPIAVGTTHGNFEVSARPRGGCD